MATPKPAAQCAVPDNRTPLQIYLDEIAPASVVGRIIKFSKDGKFITADDGEPIAEDAAFIALCDQTLIGWVRFHNNDTPPDRVMGLLYDGFIMPPRDALDDLDQANWSIGLSGKPSRIPGSTTCIRFCSTTRPRSCSRSLLVRALAGAP
jgi:hypothetical protein